MDLSNTGERDIRSQIRDRFVADLKSEKFLLYFQSIVPVAPAAPDGALFREILIRFHEEERDLMPPGTFLPTLEREGLMPMLDRWVVDSTVKWIKRLQASSTTRAAPRCSLNVSSDTIQRDLGFADFVGQVAARAGLPPNSLSFEIPLEDVISAAPAVKRLVPALRAAGCGVAFSGFAGEPVALALARSLSVRFVKIDGSLVYRLSRDSSAIAKLQQIQEICRSVGVQTICTQVEDRQTLEILRRLQVNYAQGFGIDRPRPLR